MRVTECSDARRSVTVAGGEGGGGRGGRGQLDEDMAIVVRCEVDAAVRTKVRDHE